MNLLWIMPPLHRAAVVIVWNFVASVHMIWNVPYQVLWWKRVFVLLLMLWGICLSCLLLYWACGVSMNVFFFNFFTGWGWGGVAFSFVFYAWGFYQIICFRVPLFVCNRKQTTMQTYMIHQLALSHKPFILRSGHHKRELHLWNWEINWWTEPKERRFSAF